MGFLSEYGTARTAERFYDQNALGDQRQKISDQEAQTARMEKMKQAEIARRMPTLESLPTPGAAGATPTAEARPATAPVGAGRPAVAKPRESVSAGPDQTDAESARLARGRPVPANAPAGVSIDVNRLANLRRRQLQGGMLTPDETKFIQQNQGVGQQMSPTGNPVAAPMQQGDTNVAAFNELKAKNNTRTPVRTPQAQYDARVAAANAPAPLSVRNNNPGNLKFAGQPGAVADARGFAVFQTPEAGAAAADRQLGLYMQRDGLNTIRGIVSKWSPVADPGNAPGSTANYASYVARQLGVSPDQPLSPQDIPRLRQVMAQFEAGTTAGTGTAPQVAQAPQPALTATPGTPLAKATSGGFTKEQTMQIAQQQITQAQQEMAHIQEMANATRDPASIMKMRTQYAVLQNLSREAELFNLYAEGRIPAEQYQFLSAKARDAAAAANAELQKAVAKAQGEIMVAGAKGEQDRVTEETKSNLAIQKIAIEAGFKPGEFKEVPMGDGKSLIAARGRLYRVETDPGNKFRPGGSTLVDITPER